MVSIAAKWFDKVADFWASRSDSERRTLKIALPIIVLMILYLLIVEPVFKAYFEKRNDYLAAQDNLTWLYEEAAPLVSRSANSCLRQTALLSADGNLQNYVQNIARRASVNARAELLPDNSSLRISVTSAPGNRLLGFVQTLTCAGFVIEGLTIGKVGEDQSMVSAQLDAIAKAVPSV